MSQSESSLDIKVADWGETDSIFISVTNIENSVLPQVLALCDASYRGVDIKDTSSVTLGADLTQIKADGPTAYVVIPTDFKTLQASGDIDINVGILEVIATATGAGEKMSLAPPHPHSVVARMAKKYGVKLIWVLTGFNFIGEQIGSLERCSEENRYIYRFEENYGYLSESLVRDKDAVNALLPISEMFVYQKSRGKTIIDVLNERYVEYRYSESRLLDYVFEGVTEFEKMQNLMDGLPANPFGEVAGDAVENYVDYIKSKKTGFTNSNVLKYFLEGGLEATVRPSGTEPKLKVYLTPVARTDSRVIAEKLIGFFNAGAKT